jgi:hypothetical protein
MKLCHVTDAFRLDGNTDKDEAKWFIIQDENLFVFLLSVLRDQSIMKDVSQNEI